VCLQTGNGAKCGFERSVPGFVQRAQGEAGLFISGTSSLLLSFGAQEKVKIQGFM
jgi:hypothetical protein